MPSQAKIVLTFNSAPDEERVEALLEQLGVADDDEVVLEISYINGQPSVDMIIDLKI